MTTTLYRFFDEDDRLLYIGVAGNPARRFEQHAHEKTWWGDVVRSTHVVFEDRKDALEAERKAIEAEFPIHNRMYTVHVKSSRLKPPVSCWAKTCSWTTRLDDDLNERATRAAEKSGRSKADWLRGLIEDAVKKAEKAK